MVLFCPLCVIASANISSTMLSSTGDSRYQSSFLVLDRNRNVCTVSPLSKMLTLKLRRECVCVRVCVCVCTQNIYFSLFRFYQKQLLDYIEDFFTTNYFISNTLFFNFRIHLLQFLYRFPLNFPFLCSEIHLFLEFNVVQGFNFFFHSCANSKIYPYQWVCFF